MATEFDRIKAVIEKEKKAEMESRVRKDQLTQEESRVYQSVSEEIGKTVSSAEEVDEITKEMEAKIISNINEIKKVLDEEGRAY